MAPAILLRRFVVGLMPEVPESCIGLISVCFVALRPDQLLKLAEALHVSVEDLVETNGAKKRGSGPTGKMRQLFEAASRLPRSQQQKIAAIIEPSLFITPDAETQHFIGPTEPPT